MKPTQARWWYDQIRRGSGYPFGFLPYVAFALVLLAMLAQAYITEYLAQGGSIGPAKISGELSKFLSFVATFINGGVGIASTIGILQLRQPLHVRYHKVALARVDEIHRGGYVDADKRQRMRDEIALHLTPCDQPSERERCEEELFKLAVKLASIAQS